MPLVLVVLLLVICASVRSLPAGELVQGNPRIVDGTTLRIDGRQIVLYGLLPIGTQRQCLVGRSRLPCAALAASELGRVISNQTVVCEVLGADAYGRPTARCIASGLDLTRELLRQDLADPDPAAAPLAAAGTALANDEREADGLSPAGDPPLPAGADRPALLPTAPQDAPAPPAPGYTLPPARPIPTF
jgi:endonuclease YncB( thermonuclease family)